jgi:hypothetical protein
MIHTTDPTYPDEQHIQNSWGNYEPFLSHARATSETPERYNTLVTTSRREGVRCLNSCALRPTAAAKDHGGRDRVEEAKRIRSGNQVY